MSSSHPIPAGERVIGNLLRSWHPHQDKLQLQSLPSQIPWGSQSFKRGRPSVLLSDTDSSTINHELGCRSYRCESRPPLRPTARSLVVHFRKATGWHREPFILFMLGDCVRRNRSKKNKSAPSRTPERTDQMPFHLDVRAPESRVKTSMPTALTPLRD
jgi:hypothetical protein